MLIFFINCVNIYKTAIGSLFDYVPTLIKPMIGEDKKNNLSLYIGNNGIMNMIGSQISIQNIPGKLNMMSDILRSLYTFEFYQVMKKFYRSDNDGYIKHKQMLDNLLEIDYNKYATQLSPLFESQKVPTHYSAYHICQEIYDDITKRIFWTDYICNLNTMIGYALNNDLKSLMKLDKFEDNCQKKLGIEFPLHKFKVYCMIQGLLFDTPASRYDDVISKMKIEDANDEKWMDNFLADYIKKQYNFHYQSELPKYNKLEIVLLTDRLISNMIETDNIGDFIKLFHEGLTINHVSVSISDIYKFGFSILKDELFDSNIKCLERGEKLKNINHRMR